MPARLTPSAYAEARGLSRSTIARQVRAGMPTDGDGRVDPDEADAWRAANVAPPPACAPVRGATPPRKPASLTEHRTRKAKADAERAELLVAKLRGDLLDAAGVADAAFNRARQLRDALQNWPVRVTATMAADLGIDASRLLRLLDAAVRDLLHELAGDRAEAASPNDRPRSPESAGASGRARGSDSRARPAALSSDLKGMTP